MSAVPEELVAALEALRDRRPVLVASDYDGVLARLRDEPSAAVPEPGVADALTRLAEAPGVAVALVSGRGLADLQQTSGLVGPFHWIGSHGAERNGPIPAELNRRRDALVAVLAPLVAEVPGARLEIKPGSVAVHVRQVADRDAAAGLLARTRALADSSLTMKPGKEVLELAVTDADKGSALRELAADLAARSVVYLGDDVTDEDAFRALGPDDVSIKVGDGESAARYRVPDVDAAREVLARLGALLA